MPKRKGSHDVASHVRGAFIRACKSLEDAGKPLSTIIEEMLQDDPKAALDAVAKFVPKEMLIEASITQELDEMSDEAIAGEVARLIRTAAPLLAAEDSRTETQH
jgi:hypothetical protein